MGGLEGGQVVAFCLQERVRLGKGRLGEVKVG